MTFSSGFLEVLIVGAIVWCGLAATGLAFMLMRDAKAGDIW